MHDARESTIAISRSLNGTTSLRLHCGDLSPRSGAASRSRTARSINSMNTSKRRCDGRIPTDTNSQTTETYVKDCLDYLIGPAIW
jgi:hypothetical protein